MRRALTNGLRRTLALAISVSSALASVPGEPPPRATGPDTRGVEAYRVRVVNRFFGAISISRDGGRSWERLGRVLRPDPGLLHHIGDREFTAADWAPTTSVAATAVNAIHVKVDLGSDHARVFSLLPKELQEKGPTGSYRDAAASVLTDIRAGTGIFGPDASPRVGSALMQEEFPSGRLRPWPEGRAPELGDRIVLVVRRRELPAYVQIENRWAGLVTEVRGDGESRILGRVYRPLGGSGRFGGTVYQGPGRVRANHPGVLCVSTSPYGVLGGFQVVPAFHANEPTLTYVKSTTAYLVVGPANLDDPGLEGTGPLYLGHFAPGDRVEARIQGVWGDLPVVEMKKASALEVVEALRFYPSRP